MSLQSCVQENDEDPEVWYLFSWTYYQMIGPIINSPGQSEEQGTQLLELIEDCKDCIGTLLQLNSKFDQLGQELVDEEILMHCSKMMAELLSVG